LKNLYHSSLTQTHFDAIVIGSGLGGLTTAVMLAKDGKKVLVLEKHYVAGGFTHTFKRKKFVWDVGVHYVGQMDDQKSLMRKSFDYLTENKLLWADMGEVYDRVIIQGDVYDFVKGVDNQEKQLISYFPNEAEAIKKYFVLIKKVAGASKMFFAERAMPLWLSKWLGFLLRKTFTKYSSFTTKEILNTLTHNKKLKAVLCAQCGNYGLSPEKSSFGVHAMVVEHFIDGGNYPIGGSSSIHKSLEDVLIKHQGIIALKAGVKEIIIKKNKAIGVELENGDKIFGTKIISNAGAHNTFGKFIQQQDLAEKEEIKKILPSVSHVCLYLGLNKSGTELQLPKHNVWIYDNYSFELQNSHHLQTPFSQSPLTYISFPSEKDPDWNKQHTDKATIQVIGSFPYKWLKEWEEKKWQKRGDEYEKIKSTVQNTLLEELFKVYPQIRDCIEIAELSTPLSTKHFSNYNSGEIYGLEHTPQRFGVKFLRARTRIKNLYLTGQDIVCVGVGAAMFSGIITSISILNKNLLLRILRHKTEKAKS
jgi:all-trans-retinol 13,14-reductase